MGVDNRSTVLHHRETVSINFLSSCTVTAKPKAVRLGGASGILAGKTDLYHHDRANCRGYTRSH